MTVSVILSHPYDKSFNHALFETVVETLNRSGAAVCAHDLCAEKFDPRMPPEELATGLSRDDLVIQFQKELVASDTAVFIHPNWWGQPPAEMKGYIDRVIREGVGYRFAEDDSGGGAPEGLFAGKSFIVLNTSNTEATREAEVFGDPLERIWRDCVGVFCGVTKFARKVFRIVADSTPEQRAEWIREAAEIVTKNMG